MKFNIHNITFSKEELETVQLDSLQAGFVSFQHLFIFIKDKPFLMLRAGDLITEEFIQKYQNKGLASFFCLPIVNQEKFESYSLLLKKFKTYRKRNEKAQNAQELYLAFAQDYWQESEESYLTFALACFNTFYNLPSECIQELQTKSQLLYSRAFLISSISIVSALMEGVYEFYYLKDLYNTSVLMDIGLIQNGDYNFLLAKACEYERHHPGSGLSWVKSHPKNTYEADVFFKHPQASYRVAKNYEKHFTFPEILKFIVYHHEKTDGSGFPEGISFSGLAYNEVVLLLSDYMVPFGEHIFDKQDGHKVIRQEFDKLDNLEDIYLLPINHLISKWKSIMSWAINGHKEENEDIFGSSIETIGEAA